MRITLSSRTFVDRGPMCKVAQSTVLPLGKRIPGLQLDHPRQLALMQALVRFSHIAAQNPFPPRLMPTLRPLSNSPPQ